MWTTRIILLVLFFPAMAMSDGTASSQDRFTKCGALNEGPDDVHECYFAVGDEVEREMVQAYRLARSAAKAFDQHHAIDSERSTEVLLQESQVAFETYRKLHCRFPERAALGGTGAINGIVACRVALTVIRTEQLGEIAGIL
ncbi:DUF1311 domain-containing protein [Paracoccus sp. Z330]|uniref:DUF1311 domain-containing protein n=1 Tax=Paracoccus onchidii TaxID=3017813 RepID=A0ABT4ZJ16_9RHOB|nr:lysozyme inhibitor LprI family protein [Paracoccus onchidii]MDB6179345.1 DUF1311 domain-containing protein [Paracoccus onchidii]